MAIVVTVLLAVVDDVAVVTGFSVVFINLTEWGQFNLFGRLLLSKLRPLDITILFLQSFVYPSSSEVRGCPES